MPSNRQFLAVVIPSVALIALVLVVQRQTTGELRGKIARQRAQNRELARLATEHQRLIAAQPTAQELERLRADKSALARLRSELDTMHRRAEAVARVGAPGAAEGKPCVAVPSLRGGDVAYQLWKNVGQATPDATFETVLWAAAGGEVETVADLLAFDADARSHAAAAFASLPDSIRNELGTPERLIALLVADDVPLGSAMVVAQIPTETDTKVVAMVGDPTGTRKLAQFSLRADGNSWRLVVPASVVDRYAARLKAP